VTRPDSNQFRIGGVPEHFNMPWHRALESGATQATGLDCSWRDYSTGTGAMLADLAAGELDLAILLTEGAELGRGRGLPIEAVSLYTTSPLIWGVHVPPAAPWHSLAELRGRRYAISRHGSGSHLMSLALALAQGWPTGDMQFAVVDNMAGAIRALNNGEADVFMWEHFTTEPAVQAGHFRRIDDFVSPWPAWTVCANAASWRRQREPIERLLGIVAAAAAELRAQANCAAQIAKRYGLQEAAVADWLTGVAWVSKLTPPQQALAHAREMLDAADAI
jgi:ABC-type nitrate/sulfonate/bicarbonate transport system substrate-binding protein